MDKCRRQPESETQAQNDWKGKLFLEAEQRNKKKQDAGQDSPERAFGEVLHDLRIALVLYVRPDQDQRKSLCRKRAGITLMDRGRRCEFWTGRAAV